MDTQNSFSSIIKQFTQMNVNALETFERINQAITSSDDAITVSVDLFGTPDDDGNTTIKTYQIPSFGYLDKEIKRLESNLKALSGVGTSDASVKLPDGSVQRIITRKLKTPANDLTSIALPTQFETTDNDFFEDFLNPMLTVKFDVSGQIDVDTERVLVNRVIFPSSDAFASTFFDDNYRNTDQLDYNTVINSIISNGVNVTFDEQVRDLPFKTIQYYGGFDVTNIENVEREVVVDGETVTKVSKLYRLNKLTYTDGNKSLKDTELIGIGDQLMVNSGNNTTRYEIINLYAGTSQVELKLLEGFDAIKLGSDQLKIYKALEDSVSLNIHVGFDERQVVFFKAIDPSSKIIAENWSPGAGFYSNELEIQNASGGTETLSNYYKNNVADFGLFIKSLKDDFIPPASIGVTPDPVELDTENFKVVQINTHLTQNDAFDSIKKLSNDKIGVLEGIKKLDESIVSKRSEMATKKYTSDIEKNKDKNTLSSLVEKRSSEAKLYSSIVNQIKSISADQNITEISPKFRVRGFWSVPEAKLSEDTLPQEIVKFKIQYRYVSSSGKTSNIEQIPIKLKSGGKTTTTTGSFSNWVSLDTPTRKRQKDSITGKYIWITESVEDGQEVNFNQLDIPINLGENVEIRIKAISEAGYPSNPTESNWSNVIAVEFPEGLLDTTNVINLVEENAKETTYVQLVEELDSKGMYTHINDSFSANEKYFTHGSNNIASGFLSEEQTPISLFDKLVSLQQEIESLKEQLENAKGELLVTLVDEEGKTTDVEANTTTKVFAGYYTDEVADLNIKKGHIVTKTFKLLLENSKATDLELIARIIGNRNDATYPSSDSGNEVTYTMGTHIYDPAGANTVTDPTPVLTSRIENDTYYTVEGKYDLVPIQYQNISNQQSTSAIYNNQSPYQSGQRKGQFIYSRYMDVAGENVLYANAPLEKLNNPSTSVLNDMSNFEHIGISGAGTTGTNTADFIWDFSGSQLVQFSTLTSADYDNSIYVHGDHPEISTMSASDNTMPHFATLKQGDDYSHLQNAYRYDVVEGRTGKMSFGDNDQYLLGGKSCGAFLFMSPTSIGSLSVDGDNKFGKRNIGKVNKMQVNSLKAKSPNISIDIVFQYRMTDYFGVTSSTGVDTSTGKVGGRATNPIQNLTYSKTIGIDIFDNDDNQFSFDINMFAKYKPKGFNLSNTKAVILSKSI